MGAKPFGSTGMGSPMSSPSAMAAPIGGSMGAKPATSTGIPSSMRAPGSGSFSPMDIVGSGPSSVSMKSPAPAVQQPARVTDFAAHPATTMPVSAPTMAPKSFSTSMPARAMTPSGAMAGMPGHHVDGEKVGMIAEGIGLIALAALSIYFYTANHALSMQVAAGSSSSAGDAAQMATLQGQVQTLTTSNAMLQSQVQSQSQQVADLTTELQFLAVPNAATPGAVASGAVTGVLTAPTTAKGFYTLKTTEGVMVFVKNSSDALVATALKPFAGASVALGGSFIPGSDQIVVTTVNNQPVTAPAVATTTPANAPMIPAPAPSSTGQ